MWPESVDLDINRPCQTLVASGYLKVLKVHVGLIDAHAIKLNAFVGYLHEKS